tara:strand:- start:11309 stop:11827 length:519 start_codon:yes stop_codon:yes gene_type:complete
MKKFLKSSLLLAPIFLLSCSNQDAKKTSKKVEKKIEKSIEKMETAEKEVVEITLIAKGETMSEIAFEPKTLSIPANSIVKLTLENKSGTAGMFHNFVLVPMGAGQEIATAGISAGKENDFVPNDKRVLAHTKMTNIGETTQIEFEAPSKGSYHYICSFPGHYPGMVGKLVVE